MRTLLILTVFTAQAYSVLNAQAQHAVIAGRHVGKFKTKKEAVVIVGARFGEVPQRTIAMLEKLDRDHFAPFLFYDGDVRNITDWLPNTSFPQLPMHRRKEMTFLKQAYRRFSGMWKCPSKPFQTRWLASQNDFDRAWFIEEDVYFNVILIPIYSWFSSWQHAQQQSHLFFFVRINRATGTNFSKAYTNDDSDLLACGFRYNTNNPRKDPLVEACEVCHGKHVHGLISIHRLSKNLARKTIKTLLANKTGHHEYFMPTVCYLDGECNLRTISKDKWIGSFHFRPAIDPSSMYKDKLYHPVKHWIEADPKLELVEDYDDLKEEIERTWKSEPIQKIPAGYE
eukprot:jgi/Bigna1/86886/estExt_fgenesh1_pg.C_140214